MECRHSGGRRLRAGDEEIMGDSRGGVSTEAKVYTAREGTWGLA